MNEIREILAKLLLLQNSETHDAAEIVNRIKTSKDVGFILDFRARCLNAYFLIANNIVKCKSETEKASWISQCDFLVNECDKALAGNKKQFLIGFLDKLQNSLGNSLGLTMI